MPASRLRRVGEPARAILTVAAVLARDGSFPLLQRAAGLGEAEAAVAVEELVRRRLLCEKGEGLALTHDRLRDVIYRPLLAARRQILHRRVAEALDALYSDTPQARWAALAGHFREARKWVRAESALVHVGDQAAQRYAYAEAARAFIEALDLAGMGVRRVHGRTLVWLGEAYRALGDPIRAKGLAEDARAIAAQIEWTHAVAWAERLLGRLLVADGELEAAQRRFETALREFDGYDARFEVGRTPGRAREHLGRAREIFEACEAPVCAPRAA